MKQCATKCYLNKQECEQKECRLYIDYPEDFNCTSIAIKKNGAMTLREVAERLDVSFVRIKQIEDKLLEKVQEGILRASAEVLGIIWMSRKCSPRGELIVFRGEVRHLDQKVGP